MKWKLKLWTGLFFGMVIFSGMALYQAENSQEQAQCFIMFLASLSFFLLMLLWSM